MIIRAALLSCRAKTNPSKVHLFVVRQQLCPLSAFFIKPTKAKLNKTDFEFCETYTVLKTFLCLQFLVVIARVLKCSLENNDSHPLIPWSSADFKPPIGFIVSYLW